MTERTQADPQSRAAVWRVRARWVLAATFVGAGVLHFVAPEPYVRIVPPYLPAPLLLVYVSGAAEVAGGLGVLPRATRRWAGWGLIALLVAVFPANLHMALHPAQFADLGVPTWAFWARLPLQAVFIAWVWWATLARD